MSPKPTVELDPKFKEDVTEAWHRDRQRCRTDLYYLCKVLGFNDVCPEVHGKMVDALQKFTGGKDWRRGVALDGAGYQPYIPDFWKLRGHRKNLILISRDHLKTSVATVAHSIQWVINYPNVRILISSGTGDQARGFLRGIKQHFTENETFRFLFPELCPQKNVKEFGNQEQFTVPLRTHHAIKEPTFKICSSESVVSSGHYDIIKNDDLVDKETVKTSEQIAAIKRHFAMLDPLLERNQRSAETVMHGWLDVIGTIYHVNDLHNALYVAEMEKPKEQRQWNIIKLSAAPNYPLGPTLWPARWPLSELKAIENDPARGSEMLYTQYLLNPIPSKSGLVDSEKEIIFVPRKAINELLARMRLHVTVDLAGMEVNIADPDNDYTVVNLHGFDTDGRLYVIEVMRSRQVTPEEVIQYLFDLWNRYPLIFDFKVEKEAHWRVMKSFLMREQMKRQKFLPIIDLKRDNKTSKMQRIKGLQPWFRNGTIRFADDLSCKMAIINEITYFPKTSHDDFLDTLADAMQNRDGGVNSDVLPQQKVTLEDMQKQSIKDMGLVGLIGIEDDQTTETDTRCEWTGW